jgi:UDP-N-acetylmuramoyl-tripeptide--D-alanyl-D-alanine ligase
MDQKSALNNLHQLILSGATICTDSRNVVRHSIYFALKGDRFNGNDFAGQALLNGCQLAVIDEPEKNINNRYLLVDDVLETLQHLALTHRKRFTIPVIGITGSNGKTTTKELTNAVLSNKFNTIATEGNLNNHIGVPLTLLAFQEPLDIAIIEMGANHILEIDHLCKMALPGFGLITNIGKAHLEGFGSFENVISAKTELYRHVLKQNGVLFVNGDDNTLKQHTINAQKIEYGKNSVHHCSGNILSTHPFLSVSYNVNKAFGKTFPGVSGIIHSKLTGGYNFDNIMAAVTIGLYFGVENSSIVKAIENYQPSNNRSQLVETSNNKLILDAYNANPTSMAASIENFIQYKSEGKTAVFLGDMLELGSYSFEEHEHLYQIVKNNKFDLSVFVGNIFSKVVEAEDTIHIFPNVNAAEDWLANNPLKGYSILVKGSRGIKMETLQTHF